MLQDMFSRKLQGLRVNGSLCSGYSGRKGRVFAGSGRDEARVRRSRLHESRRALRIDAGRGISYRILCVTMGACEV